MTDRILPVLTQEQRAEVIKAARGLIGTPWKHQGRSKGGIDCAGVLVFAFKAAGFDPLDAEGYGRLPYRSKLEEVLRSNLGAPIPREQMRAGDIAVMKWGRAELSHVGLVSEYPYGGFALIHAYIRNRKVIEHRIDAEWLSRITEVYAP